MMAKLWSIVGIGYAVNKLGNGPQRPQQHFQRVAASVSLLGLVLLTSTVSGGTIPNRNTGPIRTSILDTSTPKTAGKMHPTHPAFANAGRQKGTEIWRIENFEPVRYPAKDFGKFYTGDSYIILNTKENKNKDLSWDVHFWLGSETSTDEAGAAAILTVQLDDVLNGEPVQHREVQDHESPVFLAYFKNGIRYEKGGVASGFHHAETNAAGQQRLFQVKGKRNVRVRQVNLSISSMNRGDCFILDAGNEIYVYVGSASKRVEKLKAISAANQIRDQDHHGRAKVHIIDDFSTPMDKEQFFTILGSGSPDQVPSESVSEDDGEFETQEERSVTLYKISDATGSLKVDTISQKPLRQEMLDTKDCFILDTGSGIFVWVGRGATQQEKTQAMTKAQGFLQIKKYPAWTHIERVVESAETAPFKQYFATWRDVGMTHTRLIRAANDEDSDSAEDTEFDAAVLHALKKSGGRAIGFMPDNGEGKLEAIYRIEESNVSEVPSEMYGMLFGGDSYVIKYHYVNKRGGQGYVLYFWQGKESSMQEKAASAMEAARLDNELNGVAVHVRVAQGFEPRHFLKVFQGKLITFMDGHADGLKNVDDPETYDENNVRLFRVKGTSMDDVRADQRPAKAASLASDDVFVLETADNVFVWKGVGASDFEKDMAASVVERIAASKALVELDEGSETPDFWDALGGQDDYDKVLDPVYAPFLEPRLFHCRILANGKFKVEEIHHFEQEDLDVDDIMVLDGGDEIYVWIGDGSTPEEREKSIEMAKQYIRTDPTERSDETVPLVKIQQGNEPRSFKRLFPAWDDDVWQSITSYEAAKEKVLESNSEMDNEIE